MAFMSRFNNPALALQPAKSRPAMAVAPKAANPVPVGVQVPASQPSVSSTYTLGSASERLGALERIGFAAALAYLFVRFALLTDLGYHIFGFSPMLPYLTAPVALIAVAFTGGFARSLKSWPGRFFCLYITWLVLATPFSVWRGGSVATLKIAFEADFSMFFLVVGLTRNWAQCRRMLTAAAAAGGINVLAASVYGESVDGRFALSFGTLENPNDLATHLLALLPLACFVIFASSRYSVNKLIFLLIAGGLLFTSLRTGSRAGFLTLLAMSIFVLLRASVTVKIAVLGAAIVLIPLALGLLPPEIRTRYLSIFDSSVVDPTHPFDAANDDSTTKQAEFARGSAMARRQLLNNSINATLQNPLFGVGPGQFAVADADLAKQAGRRAGWQVTHNSYTQASAEAGIPALIFFVGGFGGALGLLWSAYRRTRAYPELKQISMASYCLLLTGVGLSINIFFAAQAYSFYIPTFIGLAMAISSIAASEMGRLRAAKNPLRASFV
jgi:O-antigen ligase